MPPFRFFAALPDELALLIFALMVDWSDRVALCDANPRQGARALAELNPYREAFFGLAQYLCRRGPWAVTETLLRRYIRNAAAQDCDLAWLNRFSVSAANGTGLGVRYAQGTRITTRGPLPRHERLSDGMAFYLHVVTREGPAFGFTFSQPGVMVRHDTIRSPGEVAIVVHFEGGLAPQMVEAHYKRNGSSQLYTGARGMERIYQNNFKSGSVHKYHGEPGHEAIHMQCNVLAPTRRKSHRMQRQDLAKVFKKGELCRVTLEGPRGHERFVRAESQTSGTVELYRGASGHEVCYQQTWWDGKRLKTILYEEVPGQDGGVCMKRKRELDG
jgi:hypothetical protein